jgi:hypothetical protein
MSAWDSDMEYRYHSISDTFPKWDLFDESFWELVGFKTLEVQTEAIGINSGAVLWNIF